MASSDGLHYIELCKTPIRFDPVSKATNVFYDDANQQVDLHLIYIRGYKSSLFCCNCSNITFLYKVLISTGTLFRILRTNLIIHVPLVLEVPGSIPAHGEEHFGVRTRSL